MKALIDKVRGNLPFGMITVGTLLCLVLVAADIGSAATYQTANGEVVIEAEKYTRLGGTTGGTWYVNNDISGYRGSGYLESTTDDPPTLEYSSSIIRAEYDIDFTETGTYYLHLRTYATDHANNGYFATMDGRSFDYGHPDAYYITSYWKNLWWWYIDGGGAEGRGYKVSINITKAGVQRLAIYRRDKGTRIDRIWLTKHQSEPQDTDTLTLTDPAIFQSSAPGSSPMPLLWASFDGGSDGLLYRDDAFRGTTQPSYAAGSYAASEGYSGGGLRVTLGGLDFKTRLGVSGGWSSDFTVPSAGTVRLSLRYRLVHAGSFEPDECGEVLVAVDGTVVSDGPHAYLERYCGVGDGNPDQDSGWREATIDLPLAAGVHTLTVGGYLNKKTGSIEIVNVYFDDLRITPDANAPTAESYCEDGVDNDGDGLIDCEDPDCQQLSTCAGGGEANAVPVVNAGPDQTIEVSETAVLNGSATDDGIPDNTLTIDWKVISGPGVVDIADRSSLQTTAGFSAVGTYWLELSAHDGELEGTSRLQIVVNEDSMPAETDAFNQDPGAEGLVVMPAKNYSEKMDRGSSAWTPITQSGTQAMQASPDIGTRIATGYVASSPYLRFNVNFQKTGTHYVWVRGLCTGKDNSLHVGLDGRGVSSAENMTVPTNQGWVWSGVLSGGSRARLDVGTTGLHTVEVYMREDGFMLERILLTTSSGYVPSESVASEGDTGQPAESACGDGIDNDRDGLIDCDDSDCADDPGCGDTNTFLWASFDGGSDGLLYRDDVFRGTNQPSYAAGSYEASGGTSGGGLRVTLGGLDFKTRLGMSGGWSSNFTVPSAGTVHLSLRYRLVHAGSFEPDECGEVLVAVDGTLVSDGPHAYLERYCGVGDGNPDQDSGWREAAIDLPLASGVHTLTVGGYLNKKTGPIEIVNVYFDDIIVQHTEGPVFFTDDFQDDAADGWVIVNDAGKSSTWQVVDGKYTQMNNRVDSWRGSYHLGSYAVYAGGMALTDYQARLSLKSLSAYDGVRDSLGVMVRYQDKNNYIRFIMSRMQGFLRLESRVNGQFKTLQHSGRGIDLGKEYDVSIDVRCGETTCGDGADNDRDGSVDEFKVLVYLDGDPLFGAEDVGPTGGSIALFTQSMAAFDNIRIARPSAIPQVVIQQPVAHTVLTADPTQSQHALFVSALTLNLPDAYGVKFAIDDGAPNEIIDFTGLASGTFTNVPKGDRRLAAVIVDQDGEPLSDASLGQEDVNAGVGVGGRLLVAIGDSITNGVGDNREDDNDSANGKNLNRGYPPILNDLLSSSWGADTAVFIANEGLGGTTTKEGRDRLAETIARYPDSQIWLILFGTNDSGGTMPVPSGVNCREPDSFDPTHPDYDAACRSTFKGYLRDMVLRLQSRNKIPALAQVPYVRNAPASRLNLILEYNQVVRDLHAFHHLGIEPPAFYDHFMEPANHYLFFDNVHPNGSGYLDMAHMWHDNIVGSPLFE